MSNQTQVTDNKAATNDSKASKEKKLKSSTVNDDISKGRTLTGAKPDVININPVQENIDSQFETFFEKDLNELNMQQRLKKATNLRRIESKLQLAKKRALLRRGSGKTIARRAKVLAIKLLKTKLAGNRDPNSLSAMEKQRVEDILRQRKAMVNRLALRMVPKVRKKEAQRFLKKESIDLNDLKETVDLLDIIVTEEIDRQNTHLRDWGTSTLTDIFKKDTPGQHEDDEDEEEKKKVDEAFDSFFEETREALPRSGEDRKKIDLVVRSAINRHLSTKPYRQQEIQKKIFDEDVNEIFETLDEALDWIDKGEYDYEGAMARTQLQTICRNAKELIDMLKDDENMPEWVQSKITKAEDYLDSVTNYLKSRKDLDDLDNKMTESVDLSEDLRNWFDKNHPEGGWKRINSKGEVVGDCAREPGEPKPKCMSNEKRAMLTKKERASAVRAKRKHDPNPERKGDPINVSNFGKGKISEAATPAQQAAIAISMKEKGKKPKNEEVEYIDEKNVPTNPSLWSKAKSLAKQKFDVYPSAYANGWAAKWYKSKGGGWKSLNEETVQISENLQYHFENNIPLSESVFRYGSESFFETINEARELYVNGEIELTEADKHLIETDIGTFGTYRGKAVPLDLPLYEEDEKNPPLNKPKRGGPKKFYVYVRKSDGGIKKVTWGDTSGLSVKLNDPEARKSFAARHQCSMQKDRTSAAYWACNTPRYAKALGLSGGGNFYW